VQLDKSESSLACRFSSSLSFRDCKLPE